MILVDSSIWVDHFREGNRRLGTLLETSQVLTHPFVVGELALGSLKNRESILASLKGLPQVAAAADDEVMHFIEHNALWGAGIGYVDAHLLAAVRLSTGSQLWTRDKRLSAIADRMGLRAQQIH